MNRPEESCRLGILAESDSDPLKLVPVPDPDALPLKVPEFELTDETERLRVLRLGRGLLDLRHGS